MSKTKITGKVLSIQLGRDVSHFALLRKKDELVYAMSVPTPTGAVEDGAIRNPDALVTMIKDVLQTQEFRGVRQAVYTLCTSQVISEIVTTPDISASSPPTPRSQARRWTASRKPRKTSSASPPGSKKSLWKWRFLL